MTTAAFRARAGAAYAERELFTWPSAQLFLVHDKEHALLERGTFTLLLAHHSRSAHLLVVEASVGGVRWPVGKDCLVTAPPATIDHPASSCFLFRLHLPSSDDELTYQLLLFDHDHDPATAFRSHAQPEISKLQSLLALYGSLLLQQRAPTNPGPVINNPFKELEEAAGEYWVSKAKDKQIEAGPAQQGGDAAGTFERQAEMMKEAMDSTQSSHGSSSSATSPAGVSKRMMKRMQKARRISAVSKLFSKAVVRGLISAKEHIVHEAAELKNMSSALADNTKESDIRPAVANVDAITKVVEAVEEGMSQNMQPSIGRHVAYDQGCEKVLDVSTLATWTINESGLRLVLNAAMAANQSMMQVASTSRAATTHLYSVSSSCLTSCDRNTSTSTAMLATSTGKTVGEELCRAGSKSSSSSHLSSLLQSGSIDLASSGSPSASRPPRPRPRRVEFLLNNEVSSPVSVNSGKSHIQK